MTRLLVADVCSDGAQDGWRNRINLIVAHQAQRHSVSQFQSKIKFVLLDA